MTIVLLCKHILDDPNPWTLLGKVFHFLHFFQTCHKTRMSTLAFLEKLCFSEFKSYFSFKQLMCEVNETKK